MSQFKLALASDVSRGHISDIENSKSSPSLDMLYSLSDGLEIPLWQILKAADERLKAQETRKLKQ